MFPDTGGISAIAGTDPESRGLGWQVSHVKEMDVDWIRFVRGMSDKVLLPYLRLAGEFEVSTYASIPEACGMLDWIILGPFVLSHPRRMSSCLEHVRLGRKVVVIIKRDNDAGARDIHFSHMIEIAISIVPVHNDIVPIIIRAAIELQYIPDHIQWPCHDGVV